ncbi:MAG: glycosyltransferase family 4 protein [Arachnia sp.]
MDCAFLVPLDLPGPSGGTGYDMAVIGALNRAGHAVEVIRVPGAWPRPTEADRASLLRALAGHPLAVVDGILALAAPEAIRAATSKGGRVHILVHSLLTADHGLAEEERARFAASERDALAAATSCSVASRWSATDVATRCPGVLPQIASPGTSTSPLSRGSDPPHLLVLAALTPVKNQIHALRALGRVMDLPWTLGLVGSDALDPAYVERVREVIARDVDPGRVTLHGALTGQALDTVWDRTDLLLLTSTSETFGMVVTEALARGIPAVVTANTGATEALLGPGCPPGTIPAATAWPGAVVDAADPQDLSEVLRRWLSDRDLRVAWRTAALARRPRLQTWEQTAAQLATILRT